MGEHTFSTYLAMIVKRIYAQDDKKKSPRVYILQQYSMRNHSDGEYNVLLDGNLNLTLHRIFDIIFELKVEFVISMPNNSNATQFRLLSSFIDTITIEALGTIKFQHIEYDKNAYENRKHFANCELPSKYDLYISDFENVRLPNCHTEIIYNFNISKVDSLDRQYIDEFFEMQFSAISTHQCKKAFVLNQNQKDFIIERDIFDAQIVQKVIVDTRIMSKQLLDIQKTFFSLVDKQYGNIDAILRNELNEYTSEYDKSLFFPFRLSDEAYKFNELISELSKHNQSCIIFVTNPNNVEIPKTPIDIMIVDISKIKALQLFNLKNIYFTILAMCHRYDISIPIFEDPEIVQHQSLIELSHFAQDNVSFLNFEHCVFEEIFLINTNSFVQNQLR